jgi:hypothetical protein
MNSLEWLKYERKNVNSVHIYRYLPVKSELSSHFNHPNNNHLRYKLFISCIKVHHCMYTVMLHAFSHTPLSIYIHMYIYTYNYIYIHINIYLHIYIYIYVNKFYLLKFCGIYSLHQFFGQCWTYSIECQRLIYAFHR